jgi:septum formation protein
MSRRLWLASGSPRRAELLRQIGVPFTRLSAPGIDESPRAGESPHDYVYRLARDKAFAGAGHLSVETGDAVLGADTAVVIDNRILGKPDDADHAAAMLRRLSGTTHQVLSGVGLVCGNEVDVQVVSTEVVFLELDAPTIDQYVASGEPFDKAGAYGIQGYGAVLVAAIRGSYSNVVGLPLAETGQMLRRANVPVWQDQERPE